PPSARRRRECRRGRAARGSGRDGAGRMNQDQIDAWYERMHDPALFAGPLAMFALARKFGPDQLAEYLGVSLAQLSALIVEPRPDTPELLASMALRHGIAARTLRLIAETPLPPPERAD